MPSLNLVLLIVLSLDNGFEKIVFFSYTYCLLAIYILYRTVETKVNSSYYWNRHSSARPVECYIVII